MGLGRNWSQGHGEEFAILSRAFESADATKMAAFREALKDGEEIMTARAILHEGLGPLTRRNKFGEDLPDWDPYVTQFRWYDPRAKFWLPSQSTPHQIDAVMRQALLACCDLWERGCRDIRFCGICEQQQFRIRYNTIDGDDGEQARFWVEVPDHWASYDVTGRDGDDRDVSWFLADWGADAQPVGAAERHGNVMGRELREGDPVDAGAFDVGPIAYTVIEWVDGASGGIVRKRIADLPIPPTEQRRIDRMNRLNETSTWTIRPVAAAAPEPVAGAMQPALHGASVEVVPDPQTAIGAVAQGRYGRLFPQLTSSATEVSALRREVATIAGRMLSADAGAVPTASYIDAGYTFLGQFIDHDVTFDSASLLQRAIDPESLVDYRTPRLDLDSIYGGGPAQQPYLYDEKGRFVLGDNISFDQAYRPDLARTRRGVAITVDPRNDQNAILSQLTVLFLRFHNAVVDGRYPPGQARTFAEAQQLVRWHYQWLLVHHFLPAVIGADKTASYLWAAGDEPTGPQVVRALTGGGLKLNLLGGPWGVFMPVEFSAAAFRFGHSLILPGYRMNREGPTLQTIERPGLLERPQSAVDWRLFVRGLADGESVQRSAALDTKLLPQLGDLGGKVGLVPNDDKPVSLPERTLHRGLNLNLPSGQSVARELRAQGYRDVEPLNRVAIGLEDLYAAEETPLWYYILKEAELTRGGTSLGPVGGTLVAEVLLGLLVHDETSFLHAGWAPEGGDFTFADLVRAAES